MGGREQNNLTGALDNYSYHVVWLKLRIALDEVSRRRKLSYTCTWFLARRLNSTRFETFNEPVWKRHFHGKLYLIDVRVTLSFGLDYENFLLKTFRLKEI